MSLHLDTNSWKNFLLSEYFKIEQSKGDNQAKDLDEGDTPLISAGSVNNGIVKFINKGDGKSEKFEKNCITIDMFGKCYYQPFDFYAVSHGRINILTPLIKIDKWALLFICTVLEQDTLLKYSYNRMLTQGKLENIEIKIPAIGDNPNWQFMNDYMEKLFDKAKKETTEIIKISKGDANTIINLSNKVNAEDFNKWVDNKPKDKVELKTENWQEFKIGDLFKTYTGGDLIIGNIVEGDIPVISHSATNNSVKVYSQNIPSKKLFDHNKTISLADRGTFFATIQPEDFYIGTRVKALEALNENITKYMLMFIATIINNEKYKFSYGRNCTDNLDTVIIKLPTLKLDNGDFQPDWQFMEDYTKSLPYSAKL